MQMPTQASIAPTQAAIRVGKRMCKCQTLTVAPVQAYTSGDADVSDVQGQGWGYWRQRRPTGVAVDTVADV